MRTFLAGDGHQLIDDDMDEEEGFEKLMKELFENYAYESEQTQIFKNKYYDKVSEAEILENICMRFKEDIKTLENQLQK